MSAGADFRAVDGCGPTEIGTSVNETDCCAGLGYPDTDACDCSPLGPFGSVCGELGDGDVRVAECAYMGTLGTSH